MEHKFGEGAPIESPEVDMHAVYNKVMTDHFSEVMYSISEDEMAHLLQQAKMGFTIAKNAGHSISMEKAVRNAIGDVFREKGAKKYYAIYAHFFDTHQKSGAKSLYSSDFFKQGMDECGEPKSGVSPLPNHRSPYDIIMDISHIAAKSIGVGTRITYHADNNNEVYCVVGFAANLFVVAKSVEGGKSRTLNVSYVTVVPSP